MKLDLLKVWGVCVNDNYFDGQSKNIIPVYWKRKEIKDFRKRCRIHNQLIQFGIYAELNLLKNLRIVDNGKRKRGKLKSEL